ncbi:MAG: fibronectin type III-like domain-contianing protein [Sphingobacterium sp.]
MTNNGPFDGQEVAQLYLRDKQSSVVTAVKQLTRFKRLSLKNGEKGLIEFELVPEDLRIWDAHQNWVVEKGDFEVLIGSSSEDIRLEGAFHIPRDILLK